MCNSSCANKENKLSKNTDQSCTPKAALNSQVVFELFLACFISRNSTVLAVDYVLGESIL